jgi:hypothetical protein
MARSLRVFPQTAPNPFALAGNTGIWIERLEALQALGVNLFVIYRMVADRLVSIRRIAAGILPRFRR